MTFQSFLLLYTDKSRQHKAETSSRSKWRCNSNWVWSFWLTCDKCLWCGAVVPRENSVVLHVEVLLKQKEPCKMQINPHNVLEQVEGCRCAVEWRTLGESQRMWQILLLVHARNKKIYAVTDLIMREGLGCFVCGWKRISVWLLHYKSPFFFPLWIVPLIEAEAFCVTACKSLSSSPCS